MWLDKRTWSDSKFRELTTVCLPWQHWTKAVVWFDDVDIIKPYYGICYCLRVFWRAAARMLERELEQITNFKFLVKLGKSGN
jgi:hypothetical protein